MTRDSNGPIEALGFRLLLKINEHTAKCNARVATLRQQRGAKSWENDQQLCTRGTILFSWKQYCRIQERKLSFTEGNFSCISCYSISSEKWLPRNTFAIEGVFLAMLDVVSMSLASANRHKRKYV